MRLAARSIAPWKLVATGPVISTWPSARHSISSVAAVHLHRDPPAGQPAPVRVDQGGAGAGAAGEGQPGAALPDPQPDAVRREDLGEADIGALGEQRVTLQSPAELLGDQVAGRRRRRSRAGCPCCTAAGSPGSGRCSVSHRSRAAGCRCQSEPRRAHVDADAPVRPAPRPAGRRRRCGSPGTAAPVSREQQRGDAAGGVAAGAGLAAVGVADAHEQVGVGPAGGGCSVMSWSQPIPVRRSASAAHLVGRSGRAGAARSSSTTKSLPAPCILRNGMGMSGGI